MPSPLPPVSPESSEGITPVVGRNIRALIERRGREERARGLSDRLADAIARFTGSMRFVVVHLVLYGAWIAINLGWLPVEPFDPTFVVLAMVASVEAIFLSTFVLINQNRQAALAEQRAELDLQMGLLAEHEITRILGLVTAIADRMEVAEARDPALADLARDVHPEHVLEELETHRRAESERPDRGEGRP